MAENKNECSDILSGMMAANLKNTRETLGLTQDAYAAQLRIATRTLQRYEKGENPIPESLRLQTMLVFGEDISPSTELYVQVELLKAKSGVSVSWRDRIGGSRWKEFQAGVRGFRLLNFSPLARRTMAVRDCVLLFLIGFLLGGLEWIQDSGSVSGFPLLGWLYLFSLFSAPFLFAAMIPELPLARAAASILRGGNPRR